jgi:PST family polysaccharide transporter
VSPAQPETVLSRPAVRAAVRNFGWLAADKLFRLLSTVWVGFVVARYLGPADFGVLNYVLSMVGIGALLAEAGIEAVVRRDLLSEPTRAGSILLEASLVRLAVGAVCYVLLVAFAYTSEHSTVEKTLFLVMGATLFQPALFAPDLWFQSRLESRVSVSIQTAVLVAGAAGRLVLVARGSPLIAFGWMMVAEVAVMGVLLWIVAKRRGLRLGWSPTWTANVNRIWTESWPLLMSGIAVAVYMRIDAVMLRKMLDESAVGFYAAAVRFSDIWLFIPGALAISALPALMRARSASPAQYRSRLAQYCDVSALIAYALALPTALLAPWLIDLAYGSAFSNASSVLRVHVWILVFAALGVVRGQYCVNEGLTRFHLVATLVGAALNVGLNLWLIPRQGALGAAIATLAAQAVAAWISTFWHRQTRELAWMQTLALIMPFRAFRHARTSA